MSQKNFSLVLTVVISLILQAGVCHAKFDVEGFTFFKWHNPAPCFSEFGFNLENIHTIIGDGQLCISHKGRDIELWTNDTGKGEVKTYKNARFVSSMAIIDKSRKEVIDHYMNFDAYPRMMTQFTEGGVIKSEGNNKLVRLKQVYKVVVLTLSSDFWYMYTTEENGDISFLQLDGDVGAGVCRLEFIPINDNQTLVVSTTWVDLDTARFMYRTLIKAQPDIKPTAPLGAAAMMTEQYRAFIEKTDLNPPKNTEALPTCPKTPLFNTSHIPVETLRRLSDLGTLVFVHPKQWVKTPKGVKSVEFISSATQAPGSIDKIKPYSSDFTRLNEYFTQARKVKIKKKADNLNEINWNFKFGLGVVGVGLDYTTESRWKDDNTVLFTGTKGDIFPLHGAWEWIDLQNDSTLLVFSAANQISDDASWILKLGNRLPNANLITSVFMGMLIVEKQVPWLEKITSTDCAMR